MKYLVTVQEREFEIEVTPGDDGHYDLLIDGEVAHADLRSSCGESVYSLILDGDAYDVSVVEKADILQVAVGAREISLRVESEQERNARLVGASPGGTRAHTVCSQMPGIVAKVLVRAGEEVQSGTPLVILEAMKMENEVRADHAGTVGKILVVPGQTVDAGVGLVTIQ